MAGHIPKQTRRYQRGFTIVELLIVIVVIAILAAIVIVAYNGVTSRANAAAAQSAASDLSKLLANSYTTNGTYPNDLSTVNNRGPIPASSTTYAYHPGSGNSSYCATITTGNSSYKITDTATTPASGGCPGDGVGGVAAITNYQPNPRLTSSSAYYATTTPAGNTTSWSASGGPQGGGTYTVTTTAAGQLRIGMYAPAGPSISATPGSQYTMSFYLNASAPVVGASIEVNWPLSTGGSSWIATPIADLKTGWNRYSATVTAPANATSFNYAQLLSNYGGAGVVANTTFIMADTMITPGATLYNYADGYSSNWIWNGTADNATSTGPPQHLATRQAQLELARLEVKDGRRSHQYTGSD